MFTIFALRVALFLPKFLLRYMGASYPNKKSKSVSLFLNFTISTWRALYPRYSIKCSINKKKMYKLYRRQPN